MFSDAYGNTSGAIDALFTLLVYGALAGFIWFVVAQTKGHRKPKFDLQDRPSQKGFTPMQPASPPARGTAIIHPDWPLPYASSGYLKSSGWYQDPGPHFTQRYFDGSKWTLRVRDASGNELYLGEVKPPAVKPVPKSLVPNWEVDELWAIPRHSSGYTKNQGWYQDPSGSYTRRFFDGSKWTTQVEDSLGNEIQLTKPDPTSDIRENRTTSVPSQVSIPDSRVDVVSWLSKTQPKMNQASNSGTDVTKDLMALAQLFEKGLLTPEEFASAKSKLLEQK